MGDIKHLSKAVHSSVRSGVVLFDLTRVVEELIFNSLDAGATKISVAVGVGTCYIKVVDNGCGITRDGLVLLGQRYATSKFDQLAETDAVTGGFGFRGEALSSISDVSLLEVITKAHGRPNGYRKVVKGCKCLYLGIDDGRQDVGTTEAPLSRAKCEVVGSVETITSLFQIMIGKLPVYPPRFTLAVGNLTFLCNEIENFFVKFVDNKNYLLISAYAISSRGYQMLPDDELFCTVPSSSPLSLLTSGFGIEVSSFLHELSVTDGVLKLLGYMSTPHDTSSVKDWFPVIGFIEKSIIRFWNEKSSYGDLLSQGTDMLEVDNMPRKADNTSSPEDLPAKYESSKIRFMIHNEPASFGPPSPWLEMLTKECDLLSYQKYNRFTSHNASKFKEHQTGSGLVYENDYKFQSGDGLFAPPSRVNTNRESGSYLQAPDNNIFSSEDHLLGNKLFAAEKPYDNRVDISDPNFKDDNLNADANMSNEHTRTESSFDCFETCNDVYKFINDLEKPFLQHCSSSRSLPLDGESHISSERFDFQIDGLRTKRKRLEPDDLVDVGEVNKHCSSLTRLPLDGESRMSSERFDFQIDGLRTKRKWLEPDDLVDVGEVDKHCSSSRRLPLDGESRMSSERFDFQIDVLRTKRKRLELDDLVDVGDVDGNDHRFGFLWKDQWQDKGASVLPSPRPMTKSEVSINLDFLSSDRVKSYAIGGDFLSREIDLSLDSVANIRHFSSSDELFGSEWCPMMSDPLSGTKYLGVEKFSDEDALGSTNVPVDEMHVCFAESNELKYSQRPAGVYQAHTELKSVEDLLVYTRPDNKKAPAVSDDKKFKMENKSEDLHIYSMDSGEGNSVLLCVRKSYASRMGEPSHTKHAADERIRLEELRQKVLSGEKKTVTYLDTEQKLVLPEIEYQLLYNYAEQIQNWGWLCNIHAPGSRSFTKNLNLLHKQPTAITLIAVKHLSLSQMFLLFMFKRNQFGSPNHLPNCTMLYLLNVLIMECDDCSGMQVPCILGVNLTDVDLLEFLQQCAHGRPTTVPLVNLEALHKHIAKLGSWNGSSNGLWHGLRRHELNLERASHRLSSARGQC
ncbi:MUTL protein homolog 3 [Actinidia rufa]|uniref:MUTL protein homolog 3 n=1 Tax=Actinidia rufa TaxID=165716 RepID=A0A7J0GFF3_9ERIC|nr:MUTL protein homolog 3 [Actinidia rufa]